MMSEMYPNQELCEGLLKKCKKLQSVYSAGVRTPDELFYNLMVTLIHAADDDSRFNSNSRDCWEPCLRLFSSQLIQEFNWWLEREVGTANYMPAPNAFMADTSDPAEVESRRRELRPLFLALHDLVQKMVSV